MVEEDFGRLRRQRRLDALLIGALLGALALAIVTQHWAWRFDRVLYDLGLALSPRPAPTDIVIVAIDDASVAAIGRWPWRRAVHTTLLERVSAAKPHAVMLDLILSEPDPDPRQDALLAQALHAAAPVVLPAAWYVLPGGAPQIVGPIAAFGAHARVAQAEAEVDSDGILRHLFLRAGIGNANLPHAALALLEAGGQALPADLGAEPAPSPARRPGSGWVREERLALRFQGPAGHLPRVSYVDVLTGAVPAEALRGKYVLIGLTAAGLGDMHATPMGGPRGAMPGIEVIGQALHALRSADRVRAPSPVVAGSVSALAVMLATLAFAAVRRRVALALALALALLSIAVSVAFVGAGWWLTPVGFLPAMLLAYVMWVWRRLEVVMAALLREVERLEGSGPHAAQAKRIARSLRGGHFERHVLPAITLATGNLRRARRFLAVSLDGLPEAMLLADAEGRVTLANRRAAALFECEDPAELIGLELARLLAEIGGGSGADWAPRLAAVVQQRTALVVQAEQSGQGDFMVHVAPSPDVDGPRLIVTCADIGSVKLAERQREEVLAFVSHDLRSPMASIALLADLHGRGLQAMPLEQTMDEIKRLAASALSLSESFIRAGQAESKPFEWSDTDLARLLADVLRDVAPQAKARAVRMVLETGIAAVMVRVDSELLARAVGNLLTNAIKFSPPGSVVRVDLAQRERGHLISVQDNGAGMDPHQLSRLFRAYSRGVSMPSQAGVGLGLQFVQRVAQRHGGWVKVDSAPGQGARFELFVSAAPAQ